MGMGIAVVDAHGHVVVRFELEELLEHGARAVGVPKVSRWRRRKVREQAAAAHAEALIRAGVERLKLETARQ